MLNSHQFPNMKNKDPDKSSENMNDSNNSGSNFNGNNSMEVATPPIESASLINKSTNTNINTSTKLSDSVNPNAIVDESKLLDNHHIKPDHIKMLTENRFALGSDEADAKSKSSKESSEPTSTPVEMNKSTSPKKGTSDLANNEIPTASATATTKPKTKTKSKPKAKAKDNASKSKKSQKSKSIDADLNEETNNYIIDLNSEVNPRLKQNSIFDFSQLQQNPPNSSFSYNPYNMMNTYSNLPRLNSIAEDPMLSGFRRDSVLPGVDTNLMNQPYDFNSSISGPPSATNPNFVANNNNSISLLGGPNFMSRLSSDQMMINPNLYLDYQLHPDLQRDSIGNNYILLRNSIPGNNNFPPPPPPPQQSTQQQQNSSLSNQPPPALPNSKPASSSSNIGFIQPFVNSTDQMVSSRRPSEQLDPFVSPTLKPNNSGIGLSQSSNVPQPASGDIKITPKTSVSTNASDMNQRNSNGHTVLSGSSIGSISMPSGNQHIPSIFVPQIAGGSRQNSFFVRKYPSINIPNDFNTAEMDTFLKRDSVVNQDMLDSLQPGSIESSNKGSLLPKSRNNSIMQLTFPSRTNSNSIAQLFHSAHENMTNEQIENEVQQQQQQQQQQQYLFNVQQYQQQAQQAQSQGRSLPPLPQNITQTPENLLASNGIKQYPQYLVPQETYSQPYFQQQQQQQQQQYQQIQQQQQQYARQHAIQNQLQLQQLQKQQQQQSQNLQNNPNNPDVIVRKRKKQKGKAAGTSKNKKSSNVDSNIDSTDGNVSTIEEFNAGSGKGIVKRIKVEPEAKKMAIKSKVSNMKPKREINRPLVGATKVDQLMLLIQARKKGVQGKIEQTEDGKIIETNQDDQEKSLILDPLNLVGGVEKTGSNTDKPHKCQYCDKRFTQSTHLEVHLRSHMGLKPYKCDYCEKRFTQGGNLRTHMRLHTGEKPFKCEICEKSFSRKGNLQAHLITHRDYRPFICKFDGCNKGFTQLGNLKAHQNRFHLDIINELFNKLAELNEGIGSIDKLPKEEAELLEYFSGLYKNLNKGIKGRGRANETDNTNEAGPDIPSSEIQQGE